MELGCYRHYQGKEYEVIGVAKDCEDPNREDVVYRALYSSEEFGYGQLWRRSIEDFLATVEVDGRKVKRFEYIGNKNDRRK